MSRNPPPSAASHFPEGVPDPISLADWLEIMALTAPDGDASAGDMGPPLRRLGEANPEPLIARVFTEIDRRVKAAGDAYPFVRGNNVITRRGDAAAYVPYVFCLLLSYFKWKARKNVAHNPWLMFEEMAHVAAREYLNAPNTSLLFGTSARKKQANFRGAVDDLCVRLREGDGFYDQKTHAKDDKLDVVVWKDFPDNAPSQLVLFGQCAGGDDWRKKVAELQPDAFSKQWMNRTLISPVVRSFYIPHRIEPESWELWARKAGILFDRCRIAHFAHRQAAYFAEGGRFLACCKLVSRVPLN
jgi:hypothetical protein